MLLAKLPDHFAEQLAHYEFLFGEIQGKKDLWDQLVEIDSNFGWNGCKLSVYDEECTLYQDAFDARKPTSRNRRK